MIRLIRKISAIVLTCLLGLNLAVGAAVMAEPCPTPICGSGPMDMDHCSGLLNFAFPMQGCCGECNDIFCGLMKKPLQDINAVKPLPFQGSYYPFLPVTADPVSESGSRIRFSDPGYLLFAATACSQIPLYIEHLCLII